MSDTRPNPDLNAASARLEYDRTQAGVSPRTIRDIESLLVECARLRAELGVLATGNLEAQHRAYIENARLRDSHARLLKIAKDRRESIQKKIDDLHWRELFALEAVWSGMRLECDNAITTAEEFHHEGKPGADALCNIAAEFVCSGRTAAGAAWG